PAHAESSHIRCAPAPATPTAPREIHGGRCGLARCRRYAPTPDGLDAPRSCSSCCRSMSFSPMTPPPLLPGPVHARALGLARTVLDAVDLFLVLLLELRVRGGGVLRGRRGGVRRLPQLPGDAPGTGLGATD